MENNGNKHKDVNINVPTLNLLVKRPQIMVPGSNQLKIDCHNCRGAEFHIAVEPIKDGVARLTEFVCIQCNKVYKVQSDGALIGGFVNLKKDK